MPTVGDTSSGGDEFPLADSRCLVDRFTLVEDGILVTGHAFAGASSTAGANWKVVVLTDALGLPDLLVAATAGGAAPAASAWDSYAFTPAGAVPAGDYWIGVVANSFQAYLGEDASGTSPNVQMANGTFSYATPPGTWPGSDANYGVGLNVYVTYDLPASDPMDPVIVHDGLGRALIGRAGAALIVMRPV